MKLAPDVLMVPVLPSRVKTFHQWPTPVEGTSKARTKVEPLYTVTRARVLTNWSAPPFRYTA